MSLMDFNKFKKTFNSSNIVFRLIIDPNKRYDYMVHNNNIPTNVCIDVCTYVCMWEKESKLNEWK